MFADSKSHHSNSHEKKKHTINPNESPWNSIKSHKNHHEVPLIQAEITIKILYESPLDPYLVSPWCLLGVAMFRPATGVNVFLLAAIQRRHHACAWRQDAKELGAFRMGFPNGSFHGEYTYIYIYIMYII